MGVAHDESSPPKNVLVLINKCWHANDTKQYSREVETTDVDVVACTELNRLFVDGLHVIVARRTVEQLSNGRCGEMICLLEGDLTVRFV